MAEAKLIKKLYEVTLAHRLLLFDSQVSGSSMIEGKMIFSIEVGLGFAHSLFHMNLILLLAGLGQWLLHMLRILR